MAKKIRTVLTLQLPAGKATPAPPVGTALGPHGINIVEFTKSYNEKTAAQSGQIIPAKITIYEDRSFTFILKTPPAADLLRKAAGVEKGSGAVGREDAVGKVTQAQPGRLILHSREQDVRLHLDYDTTQLKADIETLNLEDGKLQQIWGEKLYRVRLKTIQKAKADKLTLRFSLAR